uniref:Uncharacterized protein n=1 Tax=Romanomermis culicivorax TaxID=13658 RepID=A0A915I2E4_ROMCU
MDCHQNDFPHGTMTSARGADHQNVSQCCALTSARGGNHQNAFLQCAMTSARGGNDQYAFPPGAVTSARRADHQNAFPRGPATSAIDAHHPILPYQNTICDKSTIQKMPPRVMQEKSKSTTNSPRMTTTMALTQSIMSLRATSPACSNDIGNRPSPCATPQRQDVLTSARSASSQDSFLQVPMMSTMDVQ